MQENNAENNGTIKERQPPAKRHLNGRMNISKVFEARMNKTNILNKIFCVFKYKENIYLKVFKKKLNLFFNKQKEIFGLICRGMNKNDEKIIFREQTLFRKMRISIMNILLKSSIQVSVYIRESLPS